MIECLVRVDRVFQDVIVYIAREGVATSDLFRRPGSHTDLKLIVRRLAEGSPVQLSDYNFYTLASVIKVKCIFYFALH